MAKGLSLDSADTYDPPEPRIGVVYIAATSDGLELRFEGHWDKEDGTIDEMPATDSAAQAIKWGLSHTDAVLVRFDARHYFWAGAGPAPTGEPAVAGTITLAEG